jgi:hypothetical protein
MERGDRGWRLNDHGLHHYCQYEKRCHIAQAHLDRGILIPTFPPSNQDSKLTLQLLLAISHGTFCFMNFHGFGWYLSSTASVLYCSYVLHNFIAWIKIKPFFVGQGCFFQPRIGIWVQRIYLITLIMSIPPIILQVFDNFRYFNNISLLYERIRPYEPLMRYVLTSFLLPVHFGGAATMSSLEH